MDSNNGNMVTEMVGTTVQDDTTDNEELSTTDVVRHFDFLRGKYYQKNIYYLYYFSGRYDDSSKNYNFYYHYIN